MFVYVVLYIEIENAQYPRLWISVEYWSENNVKTGQKCFYNIVFLNNLFSTWKILDADWQLA